MVESINSKDQDPNEQIRRSEGSMRVVETTAETSAIGGWSSNRSTDFRSVESLRLRAEFLIMDEDSEGASDQEREKPDIARQMAQDGHLDFSDDDSESDQGENVVLIPENRGLQHQLQERERMLQRLETRSDRTTTTHRVTRALFGQVDSYQREDLQMRIMFSIFIDFTIYVVPITLLGAHIDFNATCGVDLKMWILGLLMIVFVSNLQKLFMYLVVQYCRADRFLYGIVTSGIAFTILFAWLIYGNILYYSKNNDCMRQKPTRLLAYICLGYLYVGYIQIGYALSYAYIIPHALTKWWTLKSRSRAFQNQIDSISQTLARKDYDPVVHKYETMCPICLEEFNKNSVVTTLECHTKHVFHSVCLDAWIIAEHNTCPVCRDIIFPDRMQADQYHRDQAMEIQSLRRDEDVQRLVQCPFGWPF